jgi:pyruvate, water dikinase
VNTTLEGCPLCDGNATVLAKGRRVSHGCVVGKVSLVLDPRATVDVEEGSILVMPMTDPDSVPAMQRAIAIVTDRGGAMCHAAIVARELMKPCVVGTKTATEKIVSGQIVRVCANRGLILEA